MGGHGSGRWGYRERRPTCESFRSVDLPWLRRRGMLWVGCRTLLAWSRGGEQSGSIGVTVERGGLRLRYQITNRDRFNKPDGPPVDIDELVPFVYTAAQFGGRRQWLECLKCGRACRKIYGGPYFRCRQCWGLVYASTRESPFSRLLEHAERLRKRMGNKIGSAFDGDDFPPKPKRMRWKTYRRLEEQYEDLQNRWAVSAMRFGIKS